MDEYLLVLKDFVNKYRWYCSTETREPCYGLKFNQLPLPILTPSAMVEVVKFLENRFVVLNRVRDGVFVLVLLSL